MHLEINGQKVEFVNVKEMNLGELRTLKQASGMSPIHVEQLRWQADPDAWRGLIYVACVRAGVEIELEQLDELNLLDTIEQLLEAQQAEAQEAAAEDPQKPAGPDAEEERPATESESAPES